VTSMPFCLDVSSNGVCSISLLYQENQACATHLPSEPFKPHRVGEGRDRGEQEDAGANR
jgi:hypothetical protein